MINAAFCAFPVEMAASFLITLFLVKAVDLYVQLVQPELVTIVEDRNVDKVCDNNLLVGRESLKQIMCKYICVQAVTFSDAIR